jgi:hypothetical protein
MSTSPPVSPIPINKIADDELESIERESKRTTMYYSAAPEIIESYLSRQTTLDSHYPIQTFDRMTATPSIMSDIHHETIELADQRPQLRRLDKVHTSSSESLHHEPPVTKTRVRLPSPPTSPCNKVPDANTPKNVARGGSIRQRMMSAAEIQETLLNSRYSSDVRRPSSDVRHNLGGGGGDGGISSSSSDNSNLRDKDSSTPTDIINGWDDSANRTLVNWYHAFEELSYSYQYILDRNFSISTSLSVVSILSSSALGIFSGFKLWIQNDETFKSSSDAIMLVSNFVVAAITTMSKRYIDDSRNEKIKAYVAELDSFMGLICAQITVTPEYRMPAKKFYESYMKDYTKLMITMPNMSIKEMSKAKEQYKLYKRTKLNEGESERERESHV